MKVLLYEPSQGGHRPTILRYTIAALEAGKIQWVVENNELEGSAQLLVQRAVEEKCTIIYVLMLDGKGWFTWCVSHLAKRFRIRVVSIYYLYNNLVEGWKSLLWKVVLGTGHIDQIYISDECARFPGGRYPKEVRFLPDPWDPNEFPVRAQQPARTQLGLPQTGIVFLMFGMLDERKGADLFLEATMSAVRARPDIPFCFLLAGQMSPKVHALFRQCKGLQSGGRWTFFCAPIPEEDISLYYYASDYVVSAYPKWFRVSSNTITRAFAAGKPAIVPAHGVNADIVAEHQCGILFRSGDVPALADTLVQASLIKSQQRERYAAMTVSAMKVADRRRLACYQESLLASLASL